MANRSDPLSLRLPDELREALQQAANQAGRSLNAEIRMRLEASLVPDFTRPADWELGELRQEIHGLKVRVVALESKA
ncbi:Arc family DNA-binding protein [Mesorhizobium hunchu]|uniref:Arc family DNA-binding protein n=1 Tax=Mesorhizobium hunchu TaxID=3157708 RepID=UPI003CCD477B